MAPPDRLEWRGSRWKLEPEPALSLQVWDADKQWEFAQKCDLAMANIPRQDCLCLVGTPQARVPSPSKEPRGDGEEDTGEQSAAVSSAFSFPSAGLLEGIWKTHKTQTSPPSFSWAGVLLWVGSSTDRMEQICPQPQRILHHKMQLQNCLWGRIQPWNTQRLGESRFWGAPDQFRLGLAGSYIPGAQAELGLGTAPLSWRCSDLQHALETTTRPGFPLQLALESCRDGLNSCMDYMHAGAACPAWAGDAENAPRHPASRGAGIAKGQHCDSSSSPWVGLGPLLSVPFPFFPSTLLFTIVFSLILSSPFCFMGLWSHQARAGADECTQ